MSMIEQQVKELRNVSSWYKDRNSYLLGILSQAADTIEALSAKLAAVNGSGWIACEDRLPPQPKENPIFEGKPLELYLIFVKGADYAFRAFWNGKFFADGFSKLQNVEAWQPLPEPYRS